jgi:hypothetical protein
MSYRRYIWCKGIMSNNFILVIGVRQRKRDHKLEDIQIDKIEHMFVGRKEKKQRRWGSIGEFRYPKIGPKEPINALSCDR